MIGIWSAVLSQAALYYLVLGRAGLAVPSQPWGDEGKDHSAVCCVATL